VDRSGVVAAIEELRIGELDGANVTMPHKSFAATLCDHLDHDAALGGAVNTLAMRQGVLVGWTTDVTALSAAAGEVAGRTVLILGAGGAAAAALVAFRDGAVLVAAGV
jgi:shikimate dehydrogenase